MISRRYTALGLLLFSLVSCARHYYHVSENKHYIRPQVSDFQLAKPPFSLKNTMIVDTGAVYILTTVKNANYPEMDMFLRFFANGRVMMSTLAEKGKHNFNDLKNVRVGYFKLSDREIYIEVFQATQGANYLLFKGYVENNRVIINSQKLRSAHDFTFFDKPNNYARTKIDTLRGKPDW